MHFHQFTGGKSIELESEVEPSNTPTVTLDIEDMAFAASLGF